MRLILYLLWLMILPACHQKKIEETRAEIEKPKNNVAEDTFGKNQTPAPLLPTSSIYINTGTTTPEALLDFAQTLIGTPYKYASTNPAEGFDCSGFITYVFNHFNIAVPRSSIDFTDIEREIALTDSKPGDIVLFTGTDSTDRHVGHMGIITSTTNGATHFIHSTSGKANGVTISLLNKGYAIRFVKTIRIFPQNDREG